MESSTQKITLDDLDRAPEELPDTVASTDPAFYEKLRADFSRVSEEKANIQLELDKIKRANSAAEILDGLIEPFANKTFNFMCFYCAFVGLLVLMNSFGCFKNHINDGVVQILVGSTAVTVIGLVGMVLTGVFVGARNKA